jgi:restriction endonuclease S subunit
VISKTRLYEIQIPLPSLERQQQIVEGIDGWAVLAQQEEVALKILEKQMMFQVKEMWRGQARVKLESILKDVKYPKHPTEYGKDSGKFRFHTGAESTKLYTDNSDIDDLVIIVNRTNGSGKCHIFIDSKCSVATQTITFASKYDITTVFLYYYFKSDISILEQGYQGACHKNLTTQYIPKKEVIRKISAHCHFF